MGASINQFINVSLAQIRRDNPEKLKEKPAPREEEKANKYCPECEAPRGTEHVDCDYSGRAVRG